MCALLLGGALSSCFTGVESTKKVTMTRAEKKAVQPSAEEELISVLQGKPLAAWRQNSTFTLASDRVALVFDPADVACIPDSMFRTGEKLTFDGVSIAPTVAGNDEVVLRFLFNGHPLHYQTGKRPEEALTDLLSTQLPMMIDDDIVSRADSLLQGRTLFTRSLLWYDAEGERAEGRKYVPVEIVSVTPGRDSFPLLIRFRPQTNGDEPNRHLNYYMYMSLAESGADSRPFAALFSLDNPRKRYGSTTDANWELICSGQVGNGMTKEECRLSLGNPTETIGGHDRMKTIEIWRYDDGRVLRFEDGILIEHRD